MVFLTLLSSQCEEATLSLKREDKAEFIEIVETFKYMRWILYFSDNDWPEVFRNFRKTRQVWSRLGKLPRREGADPLVSAMFYQVVVQAVLIFVAETWILLTAMSNNL